MATHMGKLGVTVALFVTNGRTICTGRLKNSMGVKLTKRRLNWLIKYVKNGRVRTEIEAGENAVDHGPVVEADRVGVNPEVVHEADLAEDHEVVHETDAADPDHENLTNRKMTEKEAEVEIEDQKVEAAPEAATEDHEAAPDRDRKSF